MLTRILKRLSEAERPLDLVELAAELDIDAGTLQGMLDQLVRQGKLRKAEEMSVAACEAEHASGVYSNLRASLQYGNGATRHDLFVE